MRLDELIEQLQQLATRNPIYSRLDVVAYNPKSQKSFDVDNIKIESDGINLYLDKR